MFFSGVDEHLDFDERVHRKVGDPDDHAVGDDVSHVLLQKRHQVSQVGLLLDENSHCPGAALPGEGRIVEELLEGGVEVVFDLLVLLHHVFGVNQAQLLGVQSDLASQEGYVVNLVGLAVGSDVGRSPLGDALDVHVSLHLGELLSSRILEHVEESDHFLARDLHADTHRGLDAKVLDVLCVQVLELREVGNQQADFDYVAQHTCRFQVVHDR
mmetsp:Transcript_32778/g.50029  ORF Transcript_32778/g.50029 Transcript_32778/m.50029 type:complete len:213 (-) Transcript_32778:882-1520(-)